MTNHLSTFLDMLLESKIHHTLDVDGESTKVSFESGDFGVVGYSGFISHFVFDRAGALLRVEIWE